jgi:hypothetical protein
MFPHFFWCCYWIRDPESGMVKKSGSGLNTPDPQHWVLPYCITYGTWRVAGGQYIQSGQGLLSENPELDHGSRSGSRFLMTKILKNYIAVEYCAS